MNITRRFLKHTGLPANDAARLLAVHPTTIRKWMAEMQHPSVHAQMVMAMVINGTITTNDLHAVRDSINEDA